MKLPTLEKTGRKTQYANLIRYVPSGTYYARLRVKGKLIRRSLKMDLIAAAKLRLGVESGSLYRNPAVGLKRDRVRQKILMLPDFDQFEKFVAEFVAELENGGGRDSRNCADLVRFLAFGGFRKSEAANITWSDCDFEKGEIIVRGDPETGTKNWSIRRVPMIPEMRQLLERLRTEQADAKPGNSVMRVRECQKAIERAAKVVGMERITHHDLRHLFAALCIESGVDIPTVSRWLGHKDGGALAQKVTFKRNEPVAMAT